MIYTQKIQHAIRFAIKTHEVYQKQKRKGKDIPYITHPLTVGLILAAAGATEDIIIAGILHDTIEDSIKEKKVTKEMIVERFGEKVYELVLSVTEQDKSLSWEERKAEAIEHIKTFSNDSLLLKSADIISNVSETLSDYEKEGEVVFERFHANKEKTIENQIKTIDVILKRWTQNLLANDLKEILYKIEKIKNGTIKTDKN
jgi:(p)ppGpp synthase/HD superfamily hydrolase